MRGFAEAVKHVPGSERLKRVCGAAQERPSMCPAARFWVQRTLSLDSAVVRWVRRRLASERAPSSASSASTMRTIASSAA